MAAIYSEFLTQYCIRLAIIVYVYKDFCYTPLKTVLEDAAGLSGQHTFHLSIGNRHPDIPANLFLCFVDSSDHAETLLKKGAIPPCTLRV